MARLFLLFGCFCLHLNVFAGGLKGRVMNEKGEPLAFAKCLHSEYNKWYHDKRTRLLRTQTSSRNI